MDTPEYDVRLEGLPDGKNLQISLRLKGGPPRLLGTITNKIFEMPLASKAIYALVDAIAADLQADLDTAAKE